MPRLRIYESNSARVAAWRKRHPKLTQADAYNKARRLCKALKLACAHGDPVAMELSRSNDIHTLDEAIAYFESRASQVPLPLE